MRPNTIVFVGTYLLLLMPTYVLPYFGSNSSIVNAFSAVAGFGMTPQWWAHAWVLTMLCLLAWARGALVQRAWLPVLPVLASVFDLTPVLSSIPLLPTLLHVASILCGTIGLVTSRDEDENATTRQGALNRKLVRSAIAATLCAVGGTLLFLGATNNTVKKNRATAPAVLPPAAPAAPAPTPTLANPPRSPPSPPAESAPQASRGELKTEKNPVATKPRSPLPSAVKKKPAPEGTTTRYINLND